MDANDRPRRRSGYTRGDRIASGIGAVIGLIFVLFVVALFLTSAWAPPRY